MDTGEDCDGSALDGESCVSLGLPAGRLACADDCSFDTSGCNTPESCGDGDLDPPDEECEGDDLGAFVTALSRTLGPWRGEGHCHSSDDAGH